MLFLLTLQFCQKPAPLESQEPPPQSTDPLVVIMNQPRFTNKDSLHIGGSIQGYTQIHAVGGAAPVNGFINEAGAYGISVLLMQNQLNSILLFAEDQQHRFSDTVIVTVVHDNTPPFLTETTLPADLVSISVHTELTFQFSEPITTLITAFEAPSIDGGLAATLTSNSTIMNLPNDRLYVGLDYPLHIRVIDSALNVFDTTFALATYHTKIPTSGGFGRLAFSRDGSVLYAAHVLPDQIVAISTSTWQVLRTIPLSVSIKDLAVNPYNDLIYVAAFEAGLVVVVDPVSGVQVRSFPLIETGNPTYTPDHPYSIAFARNGIGVVCAQPVGSSGPQSVQIIDSRNSDSVYVHPAFAPEVYRTFAVFPFFDHDYMAMGDMQGSGDLYIYNSLTNTFDEIEYAHSLINRIKGHNKADRFVMYGNQGWYMFNSLGVTVDHSSYGTFYYDFTNREGEEDKMYVVETSGGSGISVFDFATDASSDNRLLLSYSEDVVVTLNGDFIINNAVSQLLIIEPKTFRQ